jgi:gliding motility-associated-like protein
MTKVPFCPETKDGRMELEVADMLEGGATYEIYKLDTIRLYDTVYWEYPTLPEFIDEVHKDEFSDSMQVQLEGIDGIDYTEWMYTVSKYLVPYKFKYGQYKIVFFDNITECDVSYEMYIPYQTEDCPDIFTQVFTPNNDGQNDLWEVSPYEKSNVKLQIFTAYGELVYEFEGLVPEEGLTWDGLDYRGRPVQAGTYMYIYQPDVKVDKSDMQCGNITLLRKR